MRHEILAYCNAGHLNDITESDLKVLTGVNIAFAKCNDDATVKVDHIKDMDGVARMKRINPAIRVIISLGGAMEPNWSNAAYTEDRRATLVRTTIDFVRKWNLDGVDLDWEFPTRSELKIESRREDKFTFTLLCRDFRKALDIAGREDDRYYSLTMATAADIFMYDAIDIPAVAEILDYFQMMTYDLRGQHTLFCMTSDAERKTMTSGHHTNLYPTKGDPFGISIQRSVNLFRAWGVPSRKLVIGSALYTKKWRNVGPENHGLGVLQSEYTGEEYAPGYGELLANYIDKNGWKRYWDDDAKAPWLYNEAERTIITYDDAESIAHKVAYLKREGLLGIMYWEYSSDASHTLTQPHYDAMYGLN